MSRCGSCGSRFLFGGVTRDGVRYCSGACANRVDLARAIAALDAAELEAAVESRRSGPCPVCHGAGPVDASGCKRVFGIMHAAVSEVRTHVGCAACRRRAVTRDLVVSLLALPSIGVVFVPSAISTALAALRSRDDGPTALFRFAVAKALVDERARAAAFAPLEQRLGGSWT